MESKNVENKANVNVYNHCLEMPPKYFIPIKVKFSRFYSRSQSMHKIKLTNLKGKTTVLVSFRLRLGEMVCYINNYYIPKSPGQTPA